MELPAVSSAAGVSISAHQHLPRSICIYCLRSLYTRTTNHGRPIGEPIPADRLHWLNWLITVVVAVTAILYQLTMGPTNSSGLEYHKRATERQQHWRPSIDGDSAAHAAAFRTTIASVLTWSWFILTAFVVLVCLPQYWTSYLHVMVLAYSAYEAIFVYRGTHVCSGVVQTHRRRLFVWTMAIPRAVMASCLVAAVYHCADRMTFGSERGIVTHDPLSGATYVEFEVNSSFFMEIVDSQLNIELAWVKTVIAAVCVCINYFFFMPESVNTNQSMERSEISRAKHQQHQQHQQYQHQQHQQHQQYQ